MATDIQTCYRHNDRRAGVRCQRCERPICPSCMTQASVGFHCPECASKGRQKVYDARSLVTRPITTFVIMALNALVFLGEQLTIDTTPPVESNANRIGTLGADWALNGPEVAAGDWWQPITAGFVHFNVFHIGMNMFLLWQLGMLLEPALGRVRFLALYVMSLLGGSCLVLVLTPDADTAGASGAVFGLLGATFVGLRSRGINPFQTAIGPLIVLNLVITFALPSISIGGHIGGLVAGAAAGWLLFELPDRVPNGKVLAPIICAVGAVALYGACLLIAEASVTTAAL